MNGLLKISDIAKFLGINQKTIRYYEEYGLFKPEYVDPYTKYRYYSLDSINTLTYIMDLRASGLSMQTIKDHLTNNLDSKLLLAELYEKKSYIDNLITVIEKKLDPKNDYEVKIMHTLPFKAYTKNIVAEDIRDLYKKLREFVTDSVTKITINKKNVSFIQFLEYNPSLKNLHFKLGIPVYEKHTEEFNLGTVLHTYHRGGIENKELAYNALRVYAMENGYKITGEGIEFYHKSINLKNGPASLLVEICIPIEYKK